MVYMLLMFFLFSFFSFFSYRYLAIASKNKVLFIQDLSQEAQAEFYSEVEMMRSLRHPNIVCFMGACCKEQKCIITEWMEAGSLWDVMHKGTRLDFLTVRRQLCPFGIPLLRDLVYSSSYLSIYLPVCLSYPI